MALTYSPRFIPEPSCRRMRQFIRFLLSAFLIFFFAARPALGQLKEAFPTPSELKKLRVDQLMDIEVTSVSKHPEKLFAAASAIQVITAEDIHGAGATNLPEALRLASNLEVAQIDSRQWAISARGFNNLFADKMLVLIDGRSVYTPLYAGVYWDVQDTLMEDLDRIEVISGPGSAQWGANAVNGVINVITKSAKDTQGGLLTASGGSFLSGMVAARYGGELAPGVYYRIYGKAVEHGESVLPTDKDATDDWRMKQGGFRVDWDASVDNQLTVQGDIYSGLFGRGISDVTKANGRNLLARWSRTLDDSSGLKFQAYFDQAYRSIPASFMQDVKTYDFDFQHRFPLGTAHEITWGLNYRIVDDDIANTPASAFLPPAVMRQVFGAFAQDEITLCTNRLHVTIGTKLEHNDYTGLEFEPNLRAAWTPDQSHTLWFAVSRALRTPSRIDRDFYSPASPPFRVVGGAKVVSEKLLAYELGYRQQIAPRLALALATFYNDYNDLRSLEPLDPPAPFPVQRSSGFRGRSLGLELTVDWNPTTFWRLHAGYTELRVHTEPQPGNLDRSSERNIVRDPNRQIFLRSLLNITPNWSLDGTARYVGPISNQGVPGYAELDLHLGWHPSGAWEISVNGQNLLHDFHAEFNAMKGRREIARGLSSQVTWRF